MSDPHERELAEVERALSVLGGRHPDQVRAAREAAEAAARRKTEQLAESAVAEKRSKRRRIILVAAGVIACIAGFAVYRFFGVRSAEDTEIAPLVARYVALGFDALPRPTFAAEERAELMTVAGDCYVLVAARGAEMRIERPTGVAGAKGEALVCTCASEAMVAVSAEHVPVRALHIGGGALGGTRAAAHRFGDHVPTVIAGDEACADEALGSFARDKRYGTQETSGDFIGAHPALAAASFTTVASARPRLPFAFVDATASRCFIASSSVAGDDLTLWEAGPSMQKAIRTKTALAWCDAKPTTYVIERSGKGTLTVVSASSPRVGGVLGLREVAARASVPITAWQKDDERGALAQDTLRASVVPDPVALGAQTIDASQTKDARLLAFSGGPGCFTTIDLDFRCSPAMAEPEALCVQAHALTWRAPPPGASCGVAYGPLPYWMSMLGELRDGGAIDAELELMTFSRRVGAMGFTPGVIEGVTEKQATVEILGRSGDDAIVAVGLWPTAPFTRPYTDGPEWSLGGEPRVIPLASGARLSLPVGDGARFAPATRRTVVFRHSTP